MKEMTNSDELMARMNDDTQKEEKDNE